MLLVVGAVFRVGLFVVVVVEDDGGACWVVSGCSRSFGWCGCGCALIFVSLDDDVVGDKT